jgi:membrane protein DedA with SNARE-associated domain
VILPVPEQLGYPALAALILGECAGLPIPGETALIVAGGLAATGKLSLALVIAVAAVSAALGDNLGYWLGRRGGRPLLMRDGLGAAHRRAAVARADRFFARHGAGAVFFGRWIAGLRYLAALMAGATGMPYRRFLAANALGAVGWAASVATVARAVGPNGSLALVGASAAVALATLLVARLRRRRQPAHAGAAATA